MNRRGKAGAGPSQIALEMVHFPILRLNCKIPFKPKFLYAIILFRYQISNRGMMQMSNPVLDAIRNRRSVVRFESTQVDEKLIEDILEAGRWAPSWLNKQPWNFVVVTDKNIKEKISEVVPTIFVQGLKEAPVCIVVCVDTSEDPYHFVEAGSVASQNMVLAAQSLGLNSCWIGIFDIKNNKNSAETKVKQLLGIPKDHRVISVLPIGHVKYDIPKKDRKTLYQIVHHNKFGEH